MRFCLPVSRASPEAGQKSGSSHHEPDYMESLDGLAPGSRLAHISATRSLLRVRQSQGCTAVALANIVAVAAQQVVMPLMPALEAGEGPALLVVWLG